MIVVKNVINIARDAGTLIMDELSHGVQVDIKADDSPVTQADRKSGDYIKKMLHRLAPEVPILSEEGTPAEQSAALASNRHWVIDPLDGTRTAIKYSQSEQGHDQFGVHIALVENGQPVLGVAHFPAMADGAGVTYFTGNDARAYKQVGDNEPRVIKVSEFRAPPLKAAVHHQENRRPETIGNSAYTPFSGVGGQRLCMVAEGQTHVAAMNDLNLGYAYKQWDLAAAHAILVRAGGDLVSAENGKTLTYRSEDYTMPPAIAGGCDTLKSLGITTAQTAVKSAVLR